MQVKEVLLTSDDGYNSPGVRLVAHALKDHYNVTIMATLDQQSGVGGKLSLKDGFQWGRSVVDGIDAYWVDGTPGDAMELALALFPNRFDITVSGMNWGCNVSSAIFGSGTVNACLRSLGLKVTNEAIALSWDLPTSVYTMSHEPDTNLEAFFEYPAPQIKQVLELAIAKKFWSVPFVNVNFPEAMTNKVAMAEISGDVKAVWKNSEYANPNTDGGHYIYRGHRIKNPKMADTFDSKALSNGFITISLCHDNLNHEAANKKHLQDTFTLK